MSILHLNHPHYRHDATGYANHEFENADLNTACRDLKRNTGNFKTIFTPSRKKLKTKCQVVYQLPGQWSWYWKLHPCPQNIDLTLSTREI